MATGEIAVSRGTSSEKILRFHFQPQENADFVWGFLKTSFTDPLHAARECRFGLGLPRSHMPRADMCESDHDRLIMSGYAREWAWVRRGPPTGSAFFNPGGGHKKTRSEQHAPLRMLGLSCESAWTRRAL